MPAGTRKEPTAGEPSGSSAFKDRIDGALVDRLAGAVAAADPTFPDREFRRTAVAGLDELELKARIAHVAQALEQHLDPDFTRAAAVLSAVVRSVDDGTVELEGWELWPVTDWVARAGRDHPGVALDLLGELTRHATGEFAIRPFIDDDPTTVLALLARWARSPDSENGEWGQRTAGLTHRLTGFVP